MAHRVRHHEGVMEIPDPAAPSAEDPDLGVALATIGNRTKSVIMAYLWQHGPSTGTQISQATGIRGATISQATQQMEAWGLIEGSIPPQMRHGRPVVFTLDRDRVRALMDRWMTFIQGRDSAVDPGE